MTILKLPIRIIALAALALSQDATADVYKCVDKDGSVTYTQTPCPNQVTTSIRTSPAPQVSETMDCKHANQFALTIARSMKAGTGSADAFAQYGGLEGLSKSAVNIINYVYVFKHSSNVSAEKVASLTHNKCKARSFGLVNCESMPFAYIEHIGGCDKDDDEDSSLAEESSAGEIEAIKQAQVLAQPPTEALVSGKSASTQALQPQTSDDEQRMQCKDRLQSQIDGINEQMRGGYSSAQSEQYRERLRVLRRSMNDC